MHVAPREQLRNVYESLGLVIRFEDLIVAAKVVWYRGAWHVRIHAHGRKRDRRIGTTAADRRRAEEIARKADAKLVLGEYSGNDERPQPLGCADELRKWHRTWTPTMKPGYEKLTEGFIENHLAPFFKNRDMREITESDLLRFIDAKLDEGLSPRTIKNFLSTLRRVYYLLQREERVTRNPAERIGELMRRVERAQATEVPEVDFWSRDEVQRILAIALETEPRFAPFLNVLFATGMRRGEALGLKWTDIDFEESRLTIRRAIGSDGAVSTPKNGRLRRVTMPPGLASTLFDWLVRRRQECLARGWPEVPEWVFCSETGTRPDARNTERVWQRVRRRAQKRGVRPLKLHCARHTWATFALRAGKSLRWVADQLGHADPSLTIRTYAHAMPDEETDLSFADFGSEGVAGRRYPSLSENAADAELAKSLEVMARREGFEPPTLRFEA